MGMPGVFAFGTFDTWSPGYLMFMAATHNGISRLYETFGNGGSADTVGADAVAQRDGAHAGTSRTRRIAARPVVAAQQQQLRDDRAARLAELLREQPRASSCATSTTRASDRSRSRRPRGRPRTCCRRAIRASGTQAELLRVMQKQARGDLARDRGVHRPGARQARRRRRTDAGGRGGAAAAARSGGAGRGGQAQRASDRPHGRRPKRANSRPAATSSAWTSRTRASPTRCSTTSTGRRTTRRSSRTTTPAGRSRRASACRPCASSTRRCSTCRWSSVTGPISAPGGVDRHRDGLRDQPQRRQRAHHAALPAEGRRHRGRRGAVRGGRPEVQPRVVHHQGRLAGRPRQGDDGTGPPAFALRRRADA